MASGPGTGTVFSVKWESVLSASGFNYLCTEKISGGRKREQEDKMCALSKNWLIWLPSPLTSARPQVSTQKAGLGSSGAHLRYQHWRWQTLQDHMGAMVGCSPFSFMLLHTDAENLAAWLLH